MTSNQEEIESAIAIALNVHEFRGVRLRERKILQQMERYDVDILDVYHVLEHNTGVRLIAGNGERYLIRGSTIDGEELSLIVTGCQSSGLKLVNLYIES